MVAAAVAKKATRTWLEESYCLLHLLLAYDETHSDTNDVCVSIDTSFGQSTIQCAPTVSHDGGVEDIHSSLSGRLILSERSALGKKRSQPIIRVSPPLVEQPLFSPHLRPKSLIL